MLFLFGALGAASPRHFEIMVVARIILGVAVGAAAATVPLFLAEMAPVHRRGRMVTINELMIVTGQFLAFLLNAIIDAIWGGEGLAVDARDRRDPRGGAAGRLFFLPDSPRWYAVKGRYEDTRRVLQLSREPAEAAEEYNVVVEHAKRDTAEDKGAAIRDLKAYAWMRRILFIGIGLAIVQQATGINTVNYYAPTILESAGVGTSAALVAHGRRRHTSA